MSQRTKEQLPRPLHRVDPQRRAAVAFRSCRTSGPGSCTVPCDLMLHVVRRGRCLHQSRRTSRTYGLRHEDRRDRVGSKLQTRDSNAGFTRYCEFPRGCAGVASRRGHRMACRRGADRPCRAFYIHRSHANEPSASCAEAGSGVRRDPSVVGGVGQAARCSQRSEPGSVGGIYGTFVQGLTTLAANAVRRAPLKALGPGVNRHGCRND